MVNDGIRAAIEAGLAARSMGQAEILARYTELARADVREFLKLSADGEPPWVDLGEDKPLHLIKELEITRTTRGADDGEGLLYDTKVKIKLHDAKAALDSLAKIQGLEKAQAAAAGVVLTVTPAELREMSDEELDELARKRGLL